MTGPRLPSAHVVVVGAGVMGSASAFYLASRGLIVLAFSQGEAQYLMAHAALDYQRLEEPHEWLTTEAVRRQEPGVAPNVVAGLHWLTGMSARTVPALAEATLKHAWCGFRPIMTDGQPPVVGYSRPLRRLDGHVHALEGQAVAVGH